MDGELTAEALRAMLDYDPTTGGFVWRHRSEFTRRWNARFAGREAGTIGRFGPAAAPYRSIMINGRRYLAHRLAFLHITGAWPPHQVDHIDCDGTNNAWANLRAATRAENLRNRRGRHTAAGRKGVHKDKHGRYVAQITLKGVCRYLGYFDTAEQAHAAYARAAIEHHGEFARVS